MTDVRVGLVGVGRIADLHAPGYRNHPHGRLAALCDLDAALLARRAREWGVAKTYARLDDLLADADIDAVEILTPHHVHADMVCAAARAGKHVSVQKPMAPTPGACDAMIAACAEAGVVFKVYENFVFYPPYVQAKEIIAGGEIGEPLVLRMKLGACRGGWHVPLKSWLWRINEKHCGRGPVVFDDGYHKFSVATDWFGPMRSVFARIDYSFAVIDAPAMITFDFEESPVLGSFEATFTPHIVCRSKYYGADERVEIVGTRGVVNVTRCTGRLLDAPPLIVTRDGRTTAYEDIPADWLDSFTACTHNFIAAVRGEAAPGLTGERGKLVTQSALAAYLSSMTGEPVTPRNVTDAVIQECER